jgi:tRNA threonylcarbamoyladenosine biosynthesis protein TsaE
MTNTRRGQEFLPSTEEETQEVGERFAADLSLGDILCLTGPLGAGKTQFVKGLARGLGFLGEVTSPSFPLVHEYEGGRLFLAHFDFFRLDKEEDVHALGFSDYLRQAVLVIEWGEKFPQLLPPETRTIVFEILENGGRRITS